MTSRQLIKAWRRRATIPGGHSLSTSEASRTLRACADDLERALDHERDDALETAVRVADENYERHFERAVVSRMNCVDPVGHDLRADEAKSIARAIRALKGSS